jgi:hypothetical protein
MDIANPIPKKIFIKKSKIKLVEYTNNKSPIAIDIPPNRITALAPKKWPTTPPKKQKILIANDVKG